VAAELHEILPEPPGESIVERLEEALELAREGKLSAVALALVYRDGNTGSSYSKLGNVSAMVGALQRLQFSLMDRNKGY
jgi:hypothetical protein